MELTTTHEINWEVPTDLDLQSFELAKLFAIGDARTTNVKARKADFIDLFGKVPRNCTVPKSIAVEKLHFGEISTFSELLEPENDFLSYKTPIILGGILIQNQRLGEEGLLSVDGTPNYLLCMARVRNQTTHHHEKIYMIVEIKYVSGWRVDTSECKGSTHVFEGPCQVLLSVY